MTGTITRVVPDRGFDFIKGDNGTDYFLHARVDAQTIGQLALGHLANLAMPLQRLAQRFGLRLRIVSKKPDDVR